MCWMCDNPEATIEDVLDILRSNIKRYGFAVEIVESDGLHPTLVSTVGLTARDKPELVVTGLPMCCGSSLVKSVAIASLAHSRDLRPGDEIPLQGGKLVEVVALDAPWAHLPNAVRLYGERVRAVQLVHTDDRGRWPWDRKYSRRNGIQPVLGTRSR